MHRVLATESESDPASSSSSLILILHRGRDDDDEAAAAASRPPPRLRRPGCIFGQGSHFSLPFLKDTFGSPYQSLELSIDRAHCSKF